MNLTDIRWLVNAIKRADRGGVVDYEKYRRLMRNMVTGMEEASHEKLRTGAIPITRYGELISKIPGRIMRFFEKALPDIVLDRCDGCGNIFCEASTPHSAGDVGNPICEHCFENFYRRCSSCEDYVHTGRATRRRSVYYCEPCHEEYFSCCGGCGDIHANDDMSWDNDNDEYCCNGCYEGSSDGRVRGYSEDVCHVHRRKWLSSPGEATDERGNGRSKTPTLWLGFELEVTTRGGFKDAVTAMLGSIKDQAILKDDSSIEGSGFEIVSLPGTINFHQTQWGDEFFEKLVKHCRGWGNDSCGMHVHLSRSALTHLQLGRFASFFGAPENRAFIEKVAGRSENHYSRVIPKKITDIKRSNWMAGRGAQGLGYTATSNADRYQAVNLQKEATIEVRVFQSNVSKVGFLKNLEFCDALANFCRIASNAQLKKDDFLKWMDMHRGSYPNFTKWGVREGLLKTRHVAKPGSTELVVAA